MPATPIRGLFRRLPRAQVEAILARAVALITEGKTIMEVQSRGGQMSQKAFPVPPADVLAECNRRLDQIDGLAKRKSYGFFAGNTVGMGGNNP